MKNKILKSFRYEIVMYSFLSVIFTVLTELCIYGAISFVVNIFRTTDEIDKKLLYVRKQPIPSVLHGQIKYRVAITISIMAIVGFFLFVTYFLILTRKFTVYMDRITKGIKEISEGDFNVRIEIDSKDEFRSMASEINAMAESIGKIREEERKNESTKNELITSVAHDLRTPLTSIIGYLDLVSEDISEYTNNSESIKENLDKVTRQRYIKVAYDKSKRLDKMIEDLFTYTKFSFGEVKLQKSEVDIVKFMEQLGDEFYPSFKENELEYEFHSNEDSIMLKVDGDLFARALANLFGNAVKYGKDGKKIKLNLSENKNEIVIDLINYGKIIPENDLEYIFDRFYRVETSRSENTGGTGLGLAIAKSIIKMHDGTITAKSDLQGTVFEIILRRE